MPILGMSLAAVCTLLCCLFSNTASLLITVETYKRVYIDPNMWAPEWTGQNLRYIFLFGKYQCIKKAQNISSRSNIQCLTSCLKQPGCNVARVAPNGCEKGSKAVKLNSDMGGVQAYKQRDHSTLSKSFSTFLPCFQVVPTL